MAWMLAHRDSYSPAETRLDAGIHVAGLVLVGLGVPVLLAIAFVVARQDGDVRPLWACGVYGLALVAMIGASALFNLLREARLAWLYQRLDHSAIFLKIAGSYTPLTFIPGHGIGLATALWLTACAGVALKLYSPVRFRALGLALYLGMGWAGVMILPAALGQSAACQPCADPCRRGGLYLGRCVLSGHAAALPLRDLACLRSGGQPDDLCRHSGACWSRVGGSWQKFDPDHPQKVILVLGWSSGSLQEGDPCSTTPI